MTQRKRSRTTAREEPERDGQRGRHGRVMLDALHVRAAIEEATGDPHPLAGDLRTEGDRITEGFRLMGHSSE